MYEFAYNEAIEDSRMTMRVSECQAMDRVIGMLREVVKERHALRLLKAGFVPTA